MFDVWLGGGDGVGMHDLIGVWTMTPEGEVWPSIDGDEVVVVVIVFIGAEEVEDDVRPRELLFEVVDDGKWVNNPDFWSLKSHRSAADLLSRTAAAAAPAAVSPGRGSMSP